MQIVDRLNANELDQNFLEGLRRPFKIKKSKSWSLVGMK